MRELAACLAAVKATACGGAFGSLDRASADGRKGLGITSCCRKWCKAPFNYGGIIYSQIPVYPEPPVLLTRGLKLPIGYALICPLQSGPKVNLDWTLKETEHGQEART